MRGDIDVTYFKGKRKVEDSIIIGDYVPIPARKFQDVSRKSVILLMENGYGTFVHQEDYSLNIRRGKGESSNLYGVSVLVRDEHLVDIWCERITRSGDHIYLFYVGEVCVASVYAEEVKVSEDLSDKGVTWK